MIKRVALCRFSIILLLFPHPAAAADGERPIALGAKPRTERSGGPYCGIYSVYTALNCVGVETDLVKVIDDKYISSPEGSSLAQLSQAVEDCGGHPRPMEGLTVSALKASRNPVILHVRRPGRGMAFNHWVLFLGVEGDRLRILDPPGEIELWPAAQLLSLWDGTGLVVSGEPLSAPEIYLASWVEEITALGLVAVLFGGAILVARPSPGLAAKKPRVLLRIVAIVCIALVSGVGWHFLAEGGFFPNGRAVGLVVARHFNADLPTVTASELDALLGDPKVQVIDARLPGDYEAGHIRGAISLPISAGAGDRERALAEVRPGCRFVVYCQSTECPWSWHIASYLAFSGYSNVTVFPGGWEEWRRYERARTKS